MFEVGLPLRRCARSALGFFVGYLFEYLSSVGNIFAFGLLLGTPGQDIGGTHIGRSAG